jgi:hypothetical protein
MRLFLPVLLLALAAGLPADDSPPVSWDRVTIGTMKTSIYVGSVTLTTAQFTRQDSTLSSTYEARVFPWFFWSETGRISITLTDAELARVARGETTDFTGEAHNHRDKPRRVTGRAYPAGVNTGKIKVRIHVDDIELIFNGTYAFGALPTA